MDALALRAIEDAVRAVREAWVEDLRALAAIDSGSYTPAGVSRVVDVLEGWMRRDGWSLERRPCGPAPGGEPLGDLLLGRVEGVGGRSVLLVGHTDTVFAQGVAAERPLRVEGPRVYAPGVCDMKGGLLVGLAAVRSLCEAGFDGFGRITFVLNPDEEIDSPGSRPTILEEAAKHDVAFVLEAARETGAIVSARKGVTTGKVQLAGRAAHAGVEPERGRSALLAASHLVVALHELNGRWEGTTVNVGVLRGGTRTNVVPEEAELELELRATTAAHQEAVEREVTRLGSAPAVDGVRAEVTLHRECGPMERTAATGRLVRLAQEVAGELGFTLEEAATGGASDANAIAALGVPTLDGLGPIGGDDHSDREWIDLESVAPRTALLAGLIARASAALPESRTA
jgi:glutamate carboxypeptidase